MTATRTTTLTVTVMDAATIYEGPESVYRYDLPGSGIVDGWALGGAIDQARKLMGAQWPAVTITVIADPSGTAVSEEAAQILRRQFALSDAEVRDEQGATGSPQFPDTTVFAAVTDSDIAGEDAALGDAPPQPATHTTDRATGSPRHRLESPSRSEIDTETGVGTVAAPSGQPRLAQCRSAQGRHAKKHPPIHNFEPLNYLDPFHGVIAAVVLVVIGVCWWTLRGTGSDIEASVDPAASAVADEASAKDAPTEEAFQFPTSFPAIGEEGEKEEEPDTEDFPDQDKHRGGIPARETTVGPVVVKLPEGFTTSEEDGVFTATGKDPNLRILIAADPMFSVPQDALYAQLREEIEADEGLDKPFERDGRFLYSEDPGDGSAVEWTTWVEGDHQLSVGCHSREEPTTIQKAACRMAVESATLIDAA